MEQCDSIPSILKRIRTEKEEEVRALINSGKATTYQRDAKRIVPGGYFARAISDGKYPINLIAEIKRASPSAGDINRNVDIIKMAKIYESGGASAISVLTDKRFGGSMEDLRRLREHSGMPLLRKDFIIHPAQIYESNVAGADAILLIVALLDMGQITDYQQAANDLGMDALVEVHNQSELEIALEAGANIIGINNRNLDTFDIDLRTTSYLLDYIPEGKIIVTESGIERWADVLQYAKRKKHPNAMLVGSAIMKAEDPRARIDELLGKKR